MLNYLLPQYWRNVISIGLRPDMDQRVRIQLISVNAFAVISIGLVSISSVVFACIGYLRAVEGLFIIPLMVFTIILNAKQKFKAAKFLIVFVMLFAITGLALANRGTGTEYALLAVACSSALFYEHVRSIIFAVLAAVMCYGFYLWYDTTHPFVADASIPYLFVNNLILLLSVSAVLAQFLIFRSLLNQYARKSGREEVIKKLQKSEARYRAMVENQSDFISLSDADGKLIFANEMFTKFIGHHTELLLHIESHTNTLSIDNPFTVKLQIMENASGEKRWIHWRNQALFDENGKLFEQLSVGRDVTELKEAESQKVNHLQSLERIAFETSHSIRGPLARILGLIYLVDKNAVRRSEFISVVDKLKTCAGELDQSTRDLDHFVNERQNRLRILVNPGQANNKFDGGPARAAHPSGTSQLF